jgi:hypothetical protein
VKVIAKACFRTSKAFDIWSTELNNRAQWKASQPHPDPRSNCPFTPLKWRWAVQHFWDPVCLQHVFQEGG